MANKEEPAETAVVTTPESGGAVATTWDDADWGESYVPAGMRAIFPEIRVVQKEHPDMPGSNKHVGEFFYADSARYAEQLDGIIVMVQASRAFFDERHPEAPACASADGVVPLPNMPLWDRATVVTKEQGEVGVPPAPRDCASCPFALWDSGKPAPCRESYLTMFEERGTANLYRFRFKGSAMGGFKRWYGRLLGTGFKRGAKRVGRPPFSQVVQIANEKVEDKERKSTYYTPTISFLEDVNPAMGPEYAQLVRDMRAQFERVAEETIATEGGENANDGGDGAGGGQRVYGNWNSGSSNSEPPDDGAPPPPEPQASFADVD